MWIKRVVNSGNSIDGGSTGTYSSLGVQDPRLGGSVRWKDWGWETPYLLLLTAIRLRLQPILILSWDEGNSSPFRLVCFSYCGLAYELVFFSLKVWTISISSTPYLVLDINNAPYSTSLWNSGTYFSVSYAAKASLRIVLRAKINLVPRSQRVLASCCVHGMKLSTLFSIKIMAGRFRSLLPSPCMGSSRIKHLWGVNFWDSTWLRPRDSYM